MWYGVLMREKLMKNLPNRWDVLAIALATLLISFPTGRL
jgi:hypothetical protein